MITVPEQRGCPRMATDCGATYRPSGACRSGSAVIKNISASGMLFFAREQLEVGTRMELKIEPGVLSIPMLSAVVEVVRSAIARNAAAEGGDAADPGYEVGVRVLSMR